ncbi:acyl carrier protein [Alkalibaculum bacchi]|uniref:Acyl carrier protein n=1 Tax=Alkalibaculum bacchi TaxID=645887 RepID=A0A366IEE2_9FIRM|nr:acyl carrier protein [Alkalibaculum bacchi]RBP68278.1 acyl carrier protein [Alkalibaculum bacchi]
MDVFETVKKIILDQIDIDESFITLEADFIEDLGADSLDLAEMVMSFEDEFDLEIEDEEIEQIKTVGDVVEYFKNR